MYENYKLTLHDFNIFGYYISSKFSCSFDETLLFSLVQGIIIILCILIHDIVWLLHFRILNAAYFGYSVVCTCITFCNFICCLVT